MNADRVAVVGIACRYPDANSPAELWQNVLAGRRAFRRLPDERTPLADYYSPDPAAPDRFYATKAAVLEGFEFDRVKYRVAGSTYRVTDLTHWLALDTAGRALADAGFPDGAGLPRRSTGVVIGNSLTGEFSRASILRLRWPYVRRTVGGTLRARGWDDAQLAEFLGELEAVYKAPFAPVDEDTLAGGLANTIAGRICNHFDLGGGGYTVDGACSSSLLSVGTAYNALLAGEIDAAVVGGVDLSIDPFEIIGFAKTGALAKTEMLVYDRKSNGFWPGEGCGMLVLMRAEDAERQGRRSYATIVGWGYSSDGKGGITRPEAAGHLLAMDRAYRRAGFDIGAVGYLEGHGTGTAVGDATELRAFTEARRKAGGDRPAVPISTLKGNIGHTKAAAGVGGLLKAILAVHHQVIPPATGNVEPHPEVTGERPALRIPESVELFPADEPIRAGVSSMGFGGINTHVVIEGSEPRRRTEIDPELAQLARSRQDCELLLFDADSTADLRGRLAGLHELVGKLSFAELGDLATTLHGELAGRRVRAAVVASGPDDAAAGIATLLGLLDGGARSVLEPAAGVFLDSRRGRPAIGFLFPGQGVGRRADGGALRRRFAEVAELYDSAGGPAGNDLVDTAAAQPRIVTSSVAALRVLSRLGIEAEVAAGHSLGELTALHWAGALDERTLLELATARGRIMRDSSAGTGAMANVSAGPDEVGALLAGTGVVIAGYNSPGQTVISGSVAEVDEVCRRAERDGLTSMRLAVSHAFHSDLVAPAAGALREEVARHELRPLNRPVASTVTGTLLAGEQDLPELLGRQVREPVRFTDAVAALAADLDLLIEVGPGRVLSRLAGEIAPELPVLPVEADSLSLSGLFRALGAAFVLGAPLRYRELSADRFTRPLPLDKQLTFLTNPCESELPGLAGLTLPAADPVEPPSPAEAARPSASGEPERQPGASPLEVLRRLAAQRAELPLEAVSADSHPLDELHLSSITVGQIVNEASRELGLSAPVATSAYATSTLAQLAQLLELAGETARPDDSQTAVPAGVQPWVRAFGVDWQPLPPARPVPAGAAAGDWQVFAADGDPLADAVATELRRAGLGDGVLLCLPREVGADQIPLMLAAARTAVSGQLRFVAVGGPVGAAGLAKTLHLEAPSVPTTLVTLPAGPAADQLPGLAAAIAADVAGTAGFTELRYAADGSRQVPVLVPLPQSSGQQSSGQQSSEQRVRLTAQDVLLVTGGGKGITAESAISLARDSGAAIGILGRSDPAADRQLADNLDRMSAAGLRWHYCQADVTAADQVATAVAELEQRLGPVTAVLHGAGGNVPASLATLDEDAFRQTVATKVDGLRAVLAAVDADRLRLLVSFSSIIGRAGLRGEAHYATANQWLTELTEQVRAERPGCRCLSLEWSVWSGTGMGERLGVLESLMREGVSPIPMDDGIAMLHTLLAEPSTPTTVVVMGRAELPTVALQPAELPLLRFLDRIRLHYPGIELVADADLSAADDPYLSDHLLDGDLLFPAVLGMEAMAQAARALTGRLDPPTLSDVEFLRPIVVPPTGSMVLRVAALQERPDELTVVLRCSDTGFSADHFKARLSYPPAAEQAVPPIETGGARLPLDPVRDLYGTVLFQGNRFRRLLGYRQLSAMSCVADLANNRIPDWFGGFLPAELVLADPGTRDAVMHSIQCCVPDAILLPAGIERLRLADPGLDAKQLTVHARERFRVGDSYCYDVDVLGPDGELVEQWQGLRLQAVRKQDGSGPWLPSLLGPYLERRVLELFDSKVGCAVYPDDPEVGGAGVDVRRRNTANALAWAIGRRVAVSYRPDGKPEVIGGPRVSSSHSAGVTLAVAAERPVTCDVELVVERGSADWRGLLGAEQLRLAQIIAGNRHEPLAVSATRVWSAVECLRKHGYAAVDTLVGGRPRSDGWVELRANGVRIATLATRLADLVSPVVFAVLVDEEA